MVLAPPSNRPDIGQYEWVNALPMADAPPALLALVVATRLQYEGSAARGPVPLTKVAAAARAIQNDENNRNSYDEWLRVGMAIYAATDGSDEGLAIFVIGPRQ